MKKQLYILFILLNFGLMAQVIPAEKKALKAVYTALNGNDWLSQKDEDLNNNWDFTVPVTNNWYGITLTDDGHHVKKIELTSLLNKNNVNGVLPVEIGSFSMLENLTLAYVNFSGETLQPAIGNLLNLIYLDVAHCHLTGNIPANFTNLKKLKHFKANTNEFSGSLSSAIGGMTSLENLLLNFNNFTSLPIEIGNLVNLQNLYVSNNQLKSIPITINNLEYLVALDLSSNSTLSIVFPNIENLHNLKILKLAKCALTGNLPIINLPSSIEEMYLDKNNFSGGLPIIYGVYINLKKLYVSENPLIGGTIPVSFQGLSSIEYLQLQNIGLTGQLPSELSVLSTLKYFTVWENNLTGNIPVSYGNWVNLKSFIVANNQLEGTIPKSIGNISSLNLIYLQGNNFTGSIPSNYAILPNLKRFIVNNNNLSGTVPNFSRRSASMNWLGLKNNAFQFGDFENEFNTYITNIGSTFDYEAQKKIDIEEQINKSIGDNTTISINCNGTQNHYKWFKNNIEIIGKTNNILRINNLQVDDAGVYYCKVTNNIVTGLIAERNEVTISVIGAESNDTE